MTYGRDAHDRLDETLDRGPDGALAALETFYNAFNRRSASLLRAIWLDDPLVQLNNPLGGILRGIEPITALYERVFTGPARVWVEFGDIVRFPSTDTVTFAGREQGEFAVVDRFIPLAIRTSRTFAYRDGTGWRQVHHHGSIDDADLLRDYQHAVAAPA